MNRRINSLQLRLTIELAALFFAASCLAVAGLIYSASQTAGSLMDRELGLRAEDLARYVTLDAAGKPRLDLPADLKRAYDKAAQRSIFAIRDKNGRLVEVSTSELAALAERWPQAGSEPSFFRLSHFGPSAQDYSGVNVLLDSAAGPVSVLVAEVSGGDQLVHSILREFVFDIAWYVPPFVAVALLLAVYSVRRSLRPLRAASAEASHIGPGPPSVCPRPMCRLRLFESLEGDGQLSALKEEVERMNRLVEQLLCVARLDSVVLDVSLPVDLRQIAEEVVGSMAHLTLASGRSIALTGAEHPVVVTGNAPAIKGALRNLVENALAHTPPGTEVIVEVRRGGVLSVLDSGPGIPVDDRARIFDILARQGSANPRNRLGLAIVMEIVRAHVASISVSDCRPCGARFDLRFGPA